ncbi:MAG TPA: glycosyltransferase family 4 protein [Ktedonobacterales bacterium]|jgi:glycosyltransferase involved in cell wall biosynthesis|nr:glycosyltransferase family 4 protein [Ktedonobacterales bacterium]
MSRLRIVAVAFDYYPFDIRVRRMAEAAADAGHEMHIICLRARSEAPHALCDGVVVHRLPLRRRFGMPLLETLLSWLWFGMLAGALLSWQQAQRAYDIVVIHNMPDFLVFCALLPKLAGAKIVLDVEDVCPELMAAKARGRTRALLERLAIWQERVSVAFSDHVITVGWPFEACLVRRHVPPAKLSLVINSADPRLFPAARRCPPPALATAGERAFVVMYYGTVAARNGVDTAVRAVALAQRHVPHVQLRIMGHGEELPHLKRLAAELDIAERVIFLEPCPSDTLVDFIVSGDIGIIPYRRDGFADLVLPTKAYELAWMRRPIIASDTVAIRSLFRPESIVLCDPTSPDAFADAIVDLYRHPEKQATMIACATEDYTPYQWEAERQKYQALLASLVPATAAGGTPAARVPTQTTRR